MALCSRVIKSGVDSAIFFAKSRAINTSSSSSLCNRFDCRNISQLAKPNNNKRAFLVDTLALVKFLQFLFLFRSFFPIKCESNRVSFSLEGFRMLLECQFFYPFTCEI
ncbi:hypothetical protein OIU85_015209 [Salix viminalis]|uniref:Uncharacterized protein n=1 Tax=Salix viminalis TaxID=40686 RepID=A0A9Q0NKD5_SALVM|nr:hypothetical protein OIU85_015209 [Salix viminalis]